MICVCVCMHLFYSFKLFTKLRTTKIYVNSEPCTFNFIIINSNVRYHINMYLWKLFSSIIIYNIYVYVYVAVVVLIGYKNIFLNGYMDFERLITTSAFVIGVVGGESNGISMVIFSGSGRSRG